MAFARHIQNTAQPTQLIVRPAFAKRLEGTLIDPRLRIPGLPELSFLQPLHELLAHCTSHRQHFRRCLAPLEQTRNGILLRFSR